MYISYIHGHPCKNTCFLAFANKKVADQSDQRLCYSLIGNIISTLVTSELSLFYLVSIAEETGLDMT